MPARTEHTPVRVPRPSRHEVRERLIAAAIDQFESRGYADTSVSSVSEAAGFSRGAAYSNFTSKEDLFLAALERNAGHRIDETLDLLADSGSASRADQAQVQARLERNQQWAILFMEFCLQAYRRPELRQRLRDTRQRMRDDFAHRLASLRHAPASSEWLPTATAILAMNNGLIIEGICDGTPVPESANLLMGLLDNLAPSAQPDRHGTVAQRR